MANFFRVTFIYIGVWFFASLLNGLICCMGISTFSKSIDNNIFFCIVFSFLFSIPVIITNWLILAIVCGVGYRSDHLFRIALNTAFLTSFLYAFLIQDFLTSVIKAPPFVFYISIVISAIASILFFKKNFKNIE